MIYFHDVDVKEVLEACRCCLLRPPDKGLKTFYTNLGRNEIYSDMLTECFDIDLTLGNDDCGICEVCVCRLQNVTEFKRQVQRSHTQLRACLEKVMQEKNVEPPIKLEMSEDRDDGSTSDGDLTSRLLLRKTHTAPAPPDSYGKPYACGICQTTFDLESTLATHMQVHEHETEPTNTQNTHTGDKYSPHPGDNYSCDICSKQFKKKVYLNSHMKSHTCQYSCEVCDRKFTLKSRLDVHKVTHTGEKLYACEVCGKRYTQKCTLNAHLKYHTGDYRFSCDVCSKRFTQKAYLIKHTRVHTGEKPYACNICNKQFSQQGNLRTHALIHAENHVIA